MNTFYIFQYNDHEMTECKLKVSQTPQLQSYSALRSFLTLFNANFLLSKCFQQQAAIFIKQALNFHFTSPTDGEIGAFNSWRATVGIIMFICLDVEVCHDCISAIRYLDMRRACLKWQSLWVGVSSQQWQVLHLPRGVWPGTNHKHRVRECAGSKLICGSYTSNLQ